MSPYRTFLSLLLGLVLLLQGWAVSAAPHLLPVAAASATVTAEQPHCPGSTAPDVQEAVDASCCDVSCPDMTRCALGHMAVSTAATVLLPPVQLTLSAEREPNPVSPPPQSPLRPPIAVYG